LNHFIQKFGHQMSDCAEVSQSELQPWHTMHPCSTTT
jgi:hypothetical protein